MVSVIRTLLIIAIIYYGFRFLARVILPWLMKRFVTKAQQKMEERMNDRHAQQQPQRPEGEVTIDHTAADRRKRGPEPDADYVDFEEVD